MSGNLSKYSFSKNSYERFIDNKIKNLVRKNYEEEIEKIPTVNEFFELYDLLYYEIPSEGDENSHQYLIEKSSELIEFDVNNSMIEELQKEITMLREDNLRKDMKILSLETGTDFNEEDLTL